METNGYFGCIICFEYELNGLLFNEVHVYTIAPGQTDSHVNESQRKFVKLDLAYGLAMVAKRIRKATLKFTQIAKSHKFYVYTLALRSTCIELRWVAKT